MKSTFKKDLETLVATELSYALQDGDAERGAEVLAELSRLLGVAIAIISCGDQNTVDEGCTFADASVREASRGSAQMAKLVLARQEKGAKPS